MSNWKPIGTAPRDGTRILVWPYWSGDQPVAEVRWRETPCTARWESVGGLHCGAKPTHWMSLPEPPKV